MKCVSEGTDAADGAGEEIRIRVAAPECYRYFFASQRGGG